MLVFIVPLKGKTASRDWSYICALCQRTLRSICNQTSDNFKVVVVYSDRPDIKFEHRAVEYVAVTGSPPYDTIFDKMVKYRIGLFYAGKRNPDYIMNVDADDCVSKHLCEFVARNNRQSGWFFDSGYIYNDNSRLIFYRKKEFNTICATCRIISWDLLDIPKRLEDIGNLRIADDHAQTQIKIKGVSLAPLPFAGSVYIKHRDSHMVRLAEKKIRKKGLWYFLTNLNQLRHYRLLTASIRKEFGLYGINN